MHATAPTEFLIAKHGGRSVSSLSRNPQSGTIPWNSRILIPTHFKLHIIRV